VEYIPTIIIIVVLLCIAVWARRSNRVLLEPGNELKDPTLFVTLVFEKIMELEDKVGYESLSKAQKIVSCIFQLWGMINLGGFRVLYCEEKKSEYIQDAPDAYKEIGAVYFSDIVQRANAIIGTEYLSKDTSIRMARMEELGSEAKESLGKLDKEFYDCQEDWNTLLSKYIAHNRNEIDGNLSY
jgi:hypothetical protein